MPTRKMTGQIWPAKFGVSWAALVLAAALGALAGCASKSDLDEISRANQVQDRRLANLERATSAALEAQSKDMASLLERELKNLRSQLKRTLNRLRKAEGTYKVLSDSSRRIDEEQRRHTQILERSEARVQMVNRRFDEQIAAIGKYRKEQEEITAELHQVLTRQLAEMHANQVRLSAVEALLKSPIGDLPSMTAADKLYRQSFGLMMSAQFDLAADKFGEFRAAYPDDERAVEALFRQGQCYYLLRKYDHTLVPAFELVDKHPQNVRIEEARWYLARSLEETGDFKLARQFYAEMITGNSRYKADAMRRVQFINKLQPDGKDNTSSR